MDDSAFVEFLPSSEEDVHGFYSQGSHISTSPFHSAQGEVKSDCVCVC